MAFCIKGLNPEPFKHYYGQSDDYLAQHGVVRYQVDCTPGFPDRIEMRDLKVGETALLLNYQHLDTTSPYRSQHAIFICEGAIKAHCSIDHIPEVMHRRVLSIRAFERNDFILDADLAQGDHIAPMIEQFFANPDVCYIHAHYAKPGCLAAKIERV